MPRKSRKQIVGHEEDIDRAAREQEYSELETELHGAARQTGVGDTDPVVDPADDLDEAEE